MSQLKSGEIEPKSLSKDDQNLIIEFLRYEENCTIEKISILLNIHRDTVRSRLKRIDDSIRTRLIATGFDPWTVISELIRVKRIIQTKAGLKEDWGLVWKTEMDTVEKLIKLGLVKEYKPEEIYDEGLKDIDVNTLRKMYEKSKMSNKQKDKEANTQNPA